MVQKKTVANSQEYSESIINTIREPLIALDQDLRVVSVSRSFYEVFKVNPKATMGKLIYDLGNKQWDIPRLRELLETILPQKASFDNYEVEHDFATIGRRIMLLNARQIQRGSGKERIILLAIEDITERRKIEKGLEKTRKKLAATKISEDETREYAESIINTIREPLIALDQDLRVVSVNRSFYEAFKVNPKETVGQLIYDLGNKQWDIPRLRELLETILPQKTSFDNYEVEHDFATIGKRTMLLNARQIERVLGKERVILLAIEDITERKHIEDSLQEVAAKLQEQTQLLDLSNAVARNMQDEIILWSSGMEKMYGWSSKEVLGRVTHELFQTIHPKPYKEICADLLRDGHWDGELIHTRKNGTKIFVASYWELQRDRDGNPKAILEINNDITERREIEKGLEKARKELAATKISEDKTRDFSESIINTIREPLIALDQDLRVVSVSRSFYDVFQVEPAETMGQLIYDLGNKQWNIPKLRELLETILPQKTSFDNYEVEHDFATIGKRTMLLNARQIQRGSGKERVILLAIEDITERREIEKGLERAHKELKELATELKRASQAKSEFLANMSHELRTPLNSIIGFSEVLSDETFGSLNDKQEKYVNNVLVSGKHLLLLINQILDTAKLESGKMNLALSSLPMKNMLNEISVLVADMASKKKLQMSVEIDEDLPNIEGDELKVKEIIYNLLSNAVKFTPEGGKMGMRAKKADSEIEVEVWDMGVGIAPENKDKIFEGFFRVDTPYSRVTEGTGLGLPLSRKLAELHGGRLSVKSEGLNKGTVVRVTLPVISRKVV